MATSKQRRKERGRDQPVADRARQAREELGPGGPVVTRLADDEDAEAAIAAGVTAAGESDRPAGSHVAPEHPVGDVPAETDVDQVETIDGDVRALRPDEKLEGRELLPDDPRPAVPEDEMDEEDLTPTARPHRRAPG
jgi:hypothetical protein